MGKQLTFADIAVGQWFHMDFAAQKDYLFEKISEDTCRCSYINRSGYMTMKARPLWEVKSTGAVQEEQDFQRRLNIPRGTIPGHSSTYPYGEH